MNTREAPYKWYRQDLKYSYDVIESMYYTQLLKNHPSTQYDNVFGENYMFFSDQRKWIEWVKFSSRYYARIEYYFHPYKRTQFIHAPNSRLAPAVLDLRSEENKKK